MVAAVFMRFQQFRRDRMCAWRYSARHVQDVQQHPGRRADEVVRGNAQEVLPLFFMDRDACLSMQERANDHADQAQGEVLLSCSSCCDNCSSDACAPVQRRRALCMPTGSILCTAQPQQHVVPCVATFGAAPGHRALHRAAATPAPEGANASVCLIPAVQCFVKDASVRWQQQDVEAVVCCCSRLQRL